MPGPVTRRDRVWVTLQAGLFLAVLAAPLAGRRRPPRGVRLLGAGLLAGGAGVALAGYRALGDSHSPWSTPVAGGRLVTTGIYRWARHPIYGGWCLGALGAALVTGSRPGLGAAAGLAALYDLRARDEERGLAAGYPAYAAYARRSRRFLPLVY
jgi:protein-S-isoprenylcysteine O-methyltransferase Ste14